MIAPNNVQPIIDVILSLRDGDEEGTIRNLQAIDGAAAPELLAALLRSGIFYAGASPKYYRKIRNLWLQRGRPALKRVQTSLKIELLSDGTADSLMPHLELFLAAYGIAGKITKGEYDSVEHEAFAGEPKSFDVTIVLLSEYWLRRYLPLGTVSPEQLVSAKTYLENLAAGLLAKRSGLVVFTSFTHGAWPAAGSLAHMNGQLPWGAALQAINGGLFELANERFLIADAQTALHVAGGTAASGKLAMIRMRSPFEESGFIALARELASILAHAFGRAHRALLTDWDNTIWGGEVGETGFHGILCGQETADGYGYYLLQSFMRDLCALGVLLAAVSRNDPKMIDVLDENPHLALRREHFASFALSWGDKSQSVKQVASDLNFGTDLMLYIDDNHVDLAEVLMAHPEIDILLAGPDPDQSLTRLSLGRFFNTARLTDNDLKRTEQTHALREQRKAMGEAGSKEEFLKSLEIKLTTTGLEEHNRERVLQLLQKTNQFNLTTKRHRLEDVKRLIAEGALIGVFDYADRFGPQGIIGLMILLPQQDSYEIDTWLMSCRVLNRGVEESMLGWALQASRCEALTGCYIQTEKNGLVRDLYPRLGFEEVDPGSNRYILTPTKTGAYEYGNAAARS